MKEWNFKEEIKEGSLAHKHSYNTMQTTKYKIKYLNEIN